MFLHAREQSGRCGVACCFQLFRLEVEVAADPSVDDEGVVSLDRQRQRAQHAGACEAFGVEMNLALY